MDFEQREGERILRTINWTNALLPDDEIVQSEWTPQGDLTIDDDTSDANTTSAFFSNVSAGETYIARNTVETDQGETLVAKMTVRGID